jgi:hypothetical protein
MIQHLTEDIQHKLLLKLLEFDYKIEYKKGRDNKVADALSRRGQAVLAISAAILDWIADIEASYVDDHHYTSIIQLLAVNDQAVPNYSVHIGILRYRCRICIGTSLDLKNKILSSLHASAIGGTFRD